MYSRSKNKDKKGNKKGNKKSDNEKHAHFHSLIQRCEELEEKKTHKKKLNS